VLTANQLIRLDGQGLSPMDAPDERYDFIGGTASDLYLVTDRSLWRHDGAVWSRLADLDPRFGRIHALWVEAPTRVWLGALFAVMQFPGAAYVDRAVGDFDAVWADGPERTFVASHASGVATIHRVVDGASTPSITTTDGRFRDIVGLASHDVYAAGTMGVYHHDGLRWDLVAPDDPVVSLWTFGGRVFGCGNGDRDDDGQPDKSPAVVYRDGARWVRLEQSPQCRQGWGTGPDDIYVLGHAGVQHWDGIGWSPIPLGPGGTRPDTLWGWARDDVYVVDRGWLVHFDGKRWTYQQQLDANERFPMVTANARDDIFVTSYRSRVMHFDGERWAPVRTPEWIASDVWATPSQLYFAGPGGLHSLARTTRWGCRPREVACDDQVDDDCDGLIDRADPEC
jgi:hypothetical protein